VTARRRLTVKLRTAAERYIALQARAIHPEGNTDSGGRWYPVRQLPCCSDIRTPSRAYPWSYMTHCRTAAHVAADLDVDPDRLRWAVHKVRAEGFLGAKAEQAWWTAGLKVGPQS
jgi:hypothetical protein